MQNTSEQNRNWSEYFWNCDYRALQDTAKEVLAALSNFTIMLFLGGFILAEATAVQGMVDVQSSSTQ